MITLALDTATPRGAVAKFAAGGKQTRKKDLGQIASAYGHVYVAQIALGADNVQTVKALAEATILTSDASPRHFADKHTGFQALLGRAARHRGWGDCYGYLLIATGRAEVMCDPVLSPWDAACFIPIITEAGGVITDWDGGPGPLLASAVATNAALAAVAILANKHAGYREKLRDFRARQTARVLAESDPRK